MVKVSLLDVPRHGIVRCPGCNAFLPSRTREDEVMCSSCYCAWRVEGSSW